MLTRHGFIATLVVLLLALTAGPALGQSTPDAVAKIQPDVVTLTSFDANGGMMHRGTGFVFSQQGFIIGPLHLLHGASRVEVLTASGNTYDLGAVGAEDREADIFAGAVEGNPPGLYSAQITGQPPTVGERIFVVGAKGGPGPAFNSGTVKSIADLPGFGRIAEITAAVPEAFAGAPIVNDQGQLIGVALFQPLPGQMRFFALPAGRLTALKDRKVPANRSWGGRAAKPWVDSPAGLAFTALNYIWLGQYDSALPIFQRVINERPDNAEALFYAGFCNARLGRWQNAADSFTALTKAKPNQARAYDSLGEALGKLDRWPDAIAAYKQTVMLEPKNPWAGVNLGTAYAHIEKYDEQIEAYKQALQINANFYPALYGMGLAYGKTGKWQEAVEQLKKAADI
ncbi:MAG: tetratricopeptide repeat-containing S1 family peptidase, partial [Blastocatellia bacterium]